PATINDLTFDADDDVERHAFLDAIVASDDVLEDRVDRIGLRLGEKADAAQIDSEDRDLHVAGQFGRAQEGAVPANDEHQLAAVCGPFVGVEGLDVDPQCAHVVGGEGHRAPVDRLGGQHAQSNSVVAEDLLYTARYFGGVVAAGVHHQQDNAV